MLLAQGAAAQDGWVTAPGTGIVAARYDAEADVYPHRIMGRIPEKHVLLARDDAGRVHSVDLRATGSNIFEDIAPRVVDADGDGVNDVVVVETDPQAGAQLAVYALRQGKLAKIAATPHIGTRFRWLAPVAVADLDGNGIVDLAYVERPHLAKTLQVWSWAAGGLTKIAEMDDLTNHRIGDELIWGGLRDCGAGAEMVLADGGFRRIVLVRLTGDGLRREKTGLAATDDGFRRALSCRN